MNNKLEQLLAQIKAESRKLALLNDEFISEILKNLALGLRKNTTLIIAENQKDLANMKENDPLYDRVLLNRERTEKIAESIEEIANYDSPIGNLLEERQLNCGLLLKKMTVPLGVVGAIFEARPNVLVDIFTLCFKSKNGCVLKGGSQCENSNRILTDIILDTLRTAGLEHCVLLLDNDREIIDDFLQADKYVDVIVPRGSQNLIDHVRENSLIPLIETGRGVVHTYFDVKGDLEKGVDIIFNAKTSRPAVCNSLDTLIIHRERLADLVFLCRKLFDFGVEIYADESSYMALEEDFMRTGWLKKASSENFGEEYLALKMSIKTVNDVKESVEHINCFGSAHSEAIITENPETAQYFMEAVDAACVYLNASTRFTDGGVFGLGAEVGISTQKLHARGPMGIRELTSYKWKLYGDGQVR